MSIEKWKNPIIVVGLGEMGSVFARAFLCSGYPVYPVMRQDSLTSVLEIVPNSTLVLVAVAEKDVDSVLDKLPRKVHQKLVLLQNELLPVNWQSFQIENPTVISVWFEKKSGQDFKVIIPSPVYGPHATQVADALHTLGIPSKVLTGPLELLIELVIKNVYILTTNIAGLQIGGTVGEMWTNHQRLALDIADEIMDVQQFLCKTSLPRKQIIQGFSAAINGDTHHQCMGRSAPSRLERTVSIGDEAGLAIPKLRGIYKTAMGAH